MSANTTQNSSVYNHYLELSKPTKEDFERVFSEHELKQLCLKHKCCVDIWRWNAVDDYRMQFTRAGRYQRWSERERLGMLAKAVNRMKPKILYSEEEIAKTKKEEWNFQLKENILSLNHWERERLRQGEQLDSARRILTSNSEYLHFEINTESMNTDELYTEPVGAISGARIENEVNTDIQVLHNFDADDSDDSISRSAFEQNVLNNVPHEAQIVEHLQSEEIAPDIADIYNVNTVSMSIDSQMTQSEEFHFFQSQDVIPASYNNFETLIPLTSTQSTQGSQEEMVQIGAYEETTNL